MSIAVTQPRCTAFDVTSNVEAVRAGTRGWWSSPKGR